MRVLLINTSERIGGAAVACHRLMEALNNNGIKAKMLVRDKQSDSLCVVSVGQPRTMKLRFLWERFVIWVAKRFDRNYLFDVDIANTGTDITRLPEFQEADLIHLHWVNQGMLSLKGIRKILASGKPIVWTMHDMWPCTAICHHARTCTHYLEKCHNCFYLNGGKQQRDLSTRIFHRKQAVYSTATIHFVACSRWLERLAKGSALTAGHAVCSIPNPLNTAVFTPGNKQIARRRLGLPEEKSLILFGSVKVTDKRKGVDYLIEACRLLADKYAARKEQPGVMVLGNGSEQLASLLPFQVYPLPFVSDERRLADIYRAADLFVTPSLQENLPNTLMEAMACGTPCVGFRIGGIPEMIDHLENGYVADYRSAEDLAAGIHCLLNTRFHDDLARAAVHKAVGCYAESIVAQRYIDLYQECLSSSHQEPSTPTH